MSVNQVNKVAKAIDPSIYPQFESDVISMLGEMRIVYDNEPAGSHAKAFAEILIKYEAYPECFK